MGCATTSVKISSIVFNVILALLGIASIAWISFNPESFQEEVLIAIYIICSLIVLFSFLGCFAAIRESVCLTATCAVFLLILAILQIIGTFVNLGDQEAQGGAAKVEKAWEHNEMDALQREHECCGKTSAQDYILLSKPIPASCYANENAADANGLFIDGCSAKLQDFYDDESVHATIVCWLLVAFELLGFFLAAFLAINFRNKQRRMQF